ncbi:hypothetical protein BV210_05925 [Halorientalis sp. IM1011]|uniref:hypothetical protein n=1 Tax=Halorientalis sp. IM1011 TaxID=1932360 RepID=UPI00097CD162|nr:hypothetical protein [Halorientalis sp. IM1011]AQL42279.1 hypothetical protein BV210_05925 [Halorientalis sp. IM1011]
MDAITDEFRVYPLPEEREHHNLIQLNPEGAAERVANHRSWAVASDAYLSDRQETVDGLSRGAKIRATIRDCESPGPAVFDGEIEVLEDESVYIDYCVLRSLPEELQPYATQVTEREFPRRGYFTPGSQADGPQVYLELYPMFGAQEELWLDILLGKRPLEDRLAAIPGVDEPATDVIVQLPESGRAFAIYYFPPQLDDEMADYRRLLNIPRGSTQEMTELYEKLTVDGGH